MSDLPLFFVGNLTPSYADTIAIDGEPVDITDADIQFRMRPVSGTALKVDAPATIADGPNGIFRYDWQAGDIDTPGYYLAWAVVTETGDSQDMPEALIEIRDHAIPVQPSYMELEEFKAAAELTGYTYVDPQIKIALLAASRGIEDVTGRRFWLDPDATSVRYYTPTSPTRLMIDDLVTLGSVEVDRNADGVFEETWTNGTDYVLEPFNAPADHWPYESILRRRMGARVFPLGYERTVKVTGRFGWAAVPSGVQTATLIIAQKLLKRIREAPFGILTVGAGIDNQSAIRIARNDPDVVPLLAAYTKHAPFA